MIKRMFLLLGLICVGFSISGSALAAEPLSVGVQGGLDFASGSVDPGSASSKTGWMAGAFAELGVTEMFFFQPEVNFLKRSVSAATQQTTLTYQLTYLQIPLLIKAKFDQIFGFRPSVFLGPDLGIRLKSEYERLNGSTVQSKGKLTGLESTNIGLVVGLGFEYAITPTISALVNGRYSWGFLDVDTSPQMLKTRDIQVLAGAQMQLF